jgi:hypothetical protein
MPDHNSAAHSSAQGPLGGQHLRTQEVKDQELEVKGQRREHRAEQRREQLPEQRLVRPRNQVKVEVKVKVGTEVEVEVEMERKTQVMMQATIQPAILRPELRGELRRVLRETKVRAARVPDQTRRRVQRRGADWAVRRSGKWGQSYGARGRAVQFPFSTSHKSEVEMTKAPEALGKAGGVLLPEASLPRRHDAQSVRLGRLTCLAAILEWAR